MTSTLSTVLCCARADRLMPVSPVVVSRESAMAVRFGPGSRLRDRHRKPLQRGCALPASRSSAFPASA